MGDNDESWAREEENRRVYRCVALSLAKLETCSDAKCQLNNALGTFDKELVNRKFSGKIHAASRNDKVGETTAIQ